jgi:hypothetical protein
MENYNLVISVKDITEESGTVTEPVSVEEQKSYMRLEGFQDVDDSAPTVFEDDDDLIETMITACRKRIEKEFAITLVPKTLRATITNLAGDIEIPRGPVNSILSLKDRYGSVVPVTGYKTVGDDFLQLECPRYEKMVIEYEAGYSDVPEALKLEIMRAVTYLFENRGDKDLKGFSFSAHEYNRNTWLA